MSKLSLPTSYIPQEVLLEYDRDMKEIRVEIPPDTFLTTMDGLEDWLNRIGFLPAGSICGYLMDFRRVRCFPKENRFVPVVEERKKSGSAN